MRFGLNNISLLSIAPDFSPLTATDNSRISAEEFDFTCHLSCDTDAVTRVAAED